MTALGVVGVLATGLALRRAQRRARDLRPAAADRRHHRDRRDLLRPGALRCGPIPGGDVNADLADALTGQLPGGIPASLVVLLAVVMLLVWVPFRRSVLGPRRLCGRLVGGRRPTCRACRSAAAKFLAYALAGLFAALGGLMLDLLHLFGRGLVGQRRRPTR